MPIRGARSPALSLAEEPRLNDPIASVATSKRHDRPGLTRRVPSIEQYLSDAKPEGTEYAALLRELLALEVEYRLRRGERPTLRRVSAAFPRSRVALELVFREAAHGLPEATPAFLVDHPRYRVLRLLGTGGMGAVYYAEHRQLERGVALKVIRPSCFPAPRRSSGSAPRPRRPRASIIPTW